ncbi:unnamed protein product, partial [Oppiella nova]
MRVCLAKLIHKFEFTLAQTPTLDYYLCNPLMGPKRLQRRVFLPSINRPLNQSVGHVQDPGTVAVCTGHDSGYGSSPYHTPYLLQMLNQYSAPGVSHLDYLSKMLTQDRTTVDSLSVFEITPVPCNGEPFTVAILGLNDQSYPG